MTRKNQFEPSYLTSFNDKDTTGLNQFQQPGRTSFELVTTSFNNNEETSLS